MLSLADLQCEVGAARFWRCNAAPACPALDCVSAAGKEEGFLICFRFRSRSGSILWEESLSDDAIAEREDLSKQA